MNHLAFAAQNAVDEDFLHYVYLSGTTDPVVKRLLKIVDKRQDWWAEHFDDEYNSPTEVLELIDELKRDLNSASEMCVEQANEIKNLRNRKVVDLMAELAQDAKAAGARALDAQLMLEREQKLRKIAEEKLQVWNILEN
jgi:hypothetical protein